MAIIIPIIVFIVFKNYFYYFRPCIIILFSLFCLDVSSGGPCQIRTGDLRIANAAFLPTELTALLWARKESNLQPHSYQECVLPLNYAPVSKILAKTKRPVKGLFAYFSFLELSRFK